VINTIMLNFIAVALVSYFTQYYYKQSGDPIMQTVPIGEAAHIPRISQFIPGMPDFVPLSVAFLLAVLMCVLVYVFLWKTKWGYELRAIGEVMGDRYRYYHDFSGEVGFLGIAVALLGRNHPLGIFFAALFFAVLRRGGIFVDAFTEYVSKDLVEVLQAVVIVFVASLQRFTRK
jgi:simple sugar transport system permease protein